MMFTANVRGMMNMMGMCMQGMCMFRCAKIKDSSCILYR